MYKNTLKEKLAKGEKVAGVLIGDYCPTLVEIAGLLNFDYVMIDCEHGYMDVDQVANLLRAAECKGITPVVRVRENNTELILRYLDIGAMGIHVPGVESAEETRRVVDACKYKLDKSGTGKRGLSATRSSNYGIGMPLKEYVKYANEEVMVFVSCENKACIDNLDEILSVEGLDAAVFGCNDLSQDLGIPGQPTNSEVYEQVERAEAIMKKHNKPMITVLRPGESAQWYYDKGYQGLLIAATSAYTNGLKAFLEKVRI